MHSNIKKTWSALLNVEPPEKRRTSNLGIPTITRYLASHDNSVEAALYRMTEGFGLPFNIFITSIELRKLILNRELDVPKSSVTIR